MCHEHPSCFCPSHRSRDRMPAVHLPGVEVVQVVIPWSLLGLPLQVCAIRACWSGARVHLPQQRPVQGGCHEPGDAGYPGAGVKDAEEVSAGHVHEANSGGGGFGSPAVLGPGALFRLRHS